MPHRYNNAVKKSIEYFDGDELAAKVFVDKYALKDKNGKLLEETPTDMHRRLAKEFARVEAKKFGDNALSEEKIFGYLDGFKSIVPGGSVMFGCGNYNSYSTLSNCYVIDSPRDSYGSIMKTDEEIVQISKRRGGVGLDISNLRPEGHTTHNSAKTSTGPVSFANRFSSSIREVGQCVAEDSLVLTKGGIKKIQDVSDSDEVLSNNSFIKVDKLLSNGEKEVFRLTTVAGYSIDVSKDHVLQSLSKDDELVCKKLEEFKEGDKISLCFNNVKSHECEYVGLENNGYENVNRKPANCKLPNVLDEKLAYVLGYSYGDGYVCNKQQVLSLSCYNDYPEIKNKIRECVKGVFDYGVTTTKGDGDLEILNIHNKTVIKFLEHNEMLKQKSVDIEFPEKILRSPVSVQCAFISGYFDADGYASGKKRGYCFASVSKKFLEKTQIVLSFLGILSKIHKEDRTDKGWRDLYTLCVVGRVSQKKFVSLMKDSVKACLCNYSAKRDGWISPFCAKKLGIKPNKYSFCSGKDKLSISVLEKIGIKNCLVNDTVASIEKIGNRETYDIMLPHTHLFSCNGIYCHNSGRRGALLIAMSVHHPDVIKFAQCKKNRMNVTGANISIKLTDEFLNAVENDTEYEQRWPVDSKEPKVSKMISAKSVWNEIIKNAHEDAEPGLLFWDTVLNDSVADCYAEEGFKTECVNPCAELSLSILDSCRLLSVNLFGIVDNAFTEFAKINWNRLYEYGKIAQRFMDDIIDLELEAIDRIIAKIKKDEDNEDIDVIERELDIWNRIRSTCESGRRTGTGITGLADTLAAVGVKYGSEDGIGLTESIYKVLKFACYESSVEIAEKIGAFPCFDHEKEKDNPFLHRFEQEVCSFDGLFVSGSAIRNKMSKVGRRNIACLTTAPTGSISMLTRTTSGIEPLFMMSSVRRKKGNLNDDGFRTDFVDDVGDHFMEFEVFHPKLKLWMDITGETDITKSPWYGCCAEDLDYKSRVLTQAAAQAHVCHSISSTVNLPADATVDDVKNVYEYAWKNGLKGITVYRNGCRSGILLEKKDEKGLDKSDDNGIIEDEKRPKELPCDVHHTVIGGKQYIVMVGLMNGKPYEVFAGKQNFIPKSVESGIIKRKKKDFYMAKFDGTGDELSPVTAIMSEMEEIITRFTSLSLRCGVNMNVLVKQLEKVGEKQELHSFARGLVRVLKKYIPDGTIEKGESCPECSCKKIVRQEGCVLCTSCGWSKCV